MEEAARMWYAAKTYEEGTYVTHALKEAVGGFGGPVAASAYVSIREHT